MTTTTTGPGAVPSGLRGVVVTSTGIGDVRGDEGFYHYRQYSAVELARTRTFEDVWFLFVHGRLPDRDERAAFAAEVTGLRALPDEVRAALPAIAAAGDRFDPLAGLRTALSLYTATLGMPTTWDAGPQRRRTDGLAVCAVTPTILAALYRLRHGEQPVEPRPDLPAAASWLHLLAGREPDPEHASAVEQYLVATIDHGFNASTFTARVVGSTGADVVSAVAAAIGAFSGPLHGGAPDRALDGLEEIGDGAPEDWVRAKVAGGMRIMGFGHAVYTTRDPRTALLREVAERLGGPLTTRAVDVERRVAATLAELKPGHPLPANVEFYAGVVMEQCGIPRSMFTPTFTVSRVVGWCAHVLEQAAERRLIRPSARYDGPPAPEPVPAP